MAQKVQTKPVYQSKAVTNKSVEEPIDMSWNDLITQEGVDEAWRKYTMTFKDVDPRFYSIIDNHQPQLVGEQKLLIKLRNNFQQNDLNQERSGMVSYLKRALRNARLELEFEVSLGENDGPKKAFTAADKFKLMLEKNPELQKFRLEFGLDLE